MFCGYKNKCLFILLMNIYCIKCELITLTAIAGTGAFMAGGWYKWDTVKDNTICRFTECCNSNYVPYDLAKLKLSLSLKMFGQPLVSELVNILHAHKETISHESGENKHSKKALVISLHGWTGVGKTYTATMVAEALYKKGMGSKYVKIFMGKKDFDCARDLEKSKKELLDIVSNTVKNCPKSLFIFDEIHDMCPSVLDAIKPLVDHHHAVDGVDYRDSIFMFISNIGGKNISDNLLHLYSQGMKRNEIEFSDFEALIRKTAFYKGGFEKADLIARHLIDHYIPFLPLEQQHVERCALTEFRINGVYDPSPEMMADALSVITYGPTEEQPIFANNGCRRFIKHIPYVIQKHKAKILEEKPEL